MAEVCRHSFGFYDLDAFRLVTCTMCYFYLFHKDKKPLYVDRQKPMQLMPRKGSGAIFPDVDNGTAMTAVCDTLSHDDCFRWKSCCQAAVRCCDSQLSTTRVYENRTAFCPKTWDGYGCWKDTPAEERAYITCPDFITPYNSPGGEVFKDCTENGTWWRHPLTDAEWSNYTFCFEKEKLQIIGYLCISFHVISLLLLVPACITFLHYRPLRIQKRIRLHLSLFLSFIVTDFFHMLWDIFVYNDLIVSKMENAFMYQNPPQCKVLYFLQRYTRMTNFFCMFSEGFFLFRLISRTFESPKSLVRYYIFSWAVPLAFMLTYAVIRETFAEESCWLKTSGNFEWILHTPNLLCLVGNALILLYILLILLGQLQSHPNEPSNYRRALKATVVLVPLFGLQLFLVIYQPPFGSPLSFFYMVAAKIIVNSQGAVVSLIFCYFNKEVHGYFRNTFKRIRSQPRRIERSFSVTTQLSTVQTHAAHPRNVPRNVGRTSNKSYIPLDTIQNEAPHNA